MHLGPHHHHDHGRAGDGEDRRLGWAFAVAVGLNVLLVIGEAVGGWWSGSMALLADAGHNLSDVAGLVLAWGAHWLRGRRRGGRWTYGWRSFTILAANLNGILLVVAIVGVALESLRRLFEPTQIAEFPVLAIALFAALLNFATAKLLARTGESDLNVRGAYLHMLADAAVSLAVVVGATAILLTDWQWIDPAISLGICVVLSLGTWGLLRESVSMLMNAAPRQVDLEQLKIALQATPEVEMVEDLHVWSISTTETVLTAHLYCPALPAGDQDALLARLRGRLRRDFEISHATLEITRGGANSLCPLEGDEESRNILT